MEGNITTVLGEREPSTVSGVTLAHEHLSIDLSREDDPGGVLDDEGAVLEELKEAREQFGLGLVVELTCQGMGRDPKALRRMSKESGVRVVCATGFYYELFHPPYVEDSSADELADRLVEEARNGVDGTGVRPGVIGEVGSHGAEMSVAEERCFRAAARAALATGLPVFTHAHLGVGAVGQLELLSEEGLPAERICLGHQDLIDDPDQHRALAEAGAYVAFDTVGKDGYQSDDVRLRLILALLESGHSERVLLSNDVSRGAYLERNGGPGYAHLFRSFVPRLREAGVGDDTLRTMLEDNPRRLLARVGASTNG